MKLKNLAIMALCAGMVINPTTYAHAEEVNNGGSARTVASDDAGYFMDYIASASCNMILDPPNAMAYVDADIIGYPDLVTKVKIYIELQHYTSEGWDTIKTWSKTVQDCSMELAGEGVIEKGKYRNRTTVTAWSGSKSETYTILSGTSEYK